LGLTESNRPAFSIPGGQIAPKAFRANDGGNDVALGSGQDHPFEYRSLDRVDPGLRAHRHLRISMAPLALILTDFDVANGAVRRGLAAALVDPRGPAQAGLARMGRQPNGRAPLPERLMQIICVEALSFLTCRR
jgi:hypothetical protein